MEHKPGRRVVKPDDYTQGCADSTVEGTRTYTYNCNAAGTAWEAKLKSTTCVIEGSCEASSTNACSGYRLVNGGGGSAPHCSAYRAGGCNDNEYPVYSNCIAQYNDSCNNGNFSGYMASCAVQSLGVTGCNGGTYSGTYSYCQSYSAGGAASCLGGIYSGGSAHCNSLSANSCSGATFKTGAYCWAFVVDSCKNNTYEGTACCYAEKANLCPAGSPKCNSSRVWDNTYW